MRSLNAPEHGFLFEAAPLLVLSMAVVFGCGAPARASASSGPPSPPSQASLSHSGIVRDARTALDARDAQAPLELPRSATPPAPWLLPPGKSLITPPLDPIAPALANEDLVIARTGAGYFALPRGGSLIGPLGVPDSTVWIGRDSRGRLLAATFAGALYRAPDVLSAKDAKKFERIAEIRGASSWDARGAFIVAARGADVLRSSDGGQTFRATHVADRIVIDNVFVRSDGAAAVIGQIPGDPGDRSLWAALQGGAFVRGPQLFADLLRAGDWIGAPPACGIVLSRDGLHWAQAETWPGEGDRDAWLRSFRLTSTLDAYISDGTAAIVESVAPPPPPAPPARLFGCRHRVKPPRVHMGSATSTGMHCAGAAFFGGSMEPLPPPSAVQVALFSDGRCAPGDADPLAWDTDQCKLGAPLARPPSVAIVDREDGSVAVGVVPPGCRPEHIFSASGAGLLVCADTTGASRVALYMTAGLSGEWISEGDLPIRADSVSGLSMASDGTLLLRAAWDNPTARRAFVRSPLPIGIARAWRSVDVTGAVELRVDTGGAVLVVGSSASTPVPSWLTFALDRPRADRIPLASVVPVQGSVLDVVIDGPHIVVWTADWYLSSDCRARVNEDRNARAVPWILTRHGALRRAEPGELAH